MVTLDGVEGEVPAKPDPSAPPAGSDTALLDRVRSGDRTAIDELLHRAQAVARRYSHAVCGKAPDSDDAVQEALLRTFRHADRIREPRAFRAWLYRTVKNACLIGRRRRTAEPLRLQSLDEAGRDGYEPADSALPADQVILGGETRDTVRRALAGIPASYREAVFLRDLEGLSTREVARVLGITEANVKVRLHRAHQRLRQALDGAPASEPGPGRRPARRRRSS
ncbi:MAG TPA: RNA polymerase sigma factor [Vicinamibacterales bacterium]|nr:RNA polymerase sigma factor [Vicinamibacterales bacterium]